MKSGMKKRWKIRGRVRKRGGDARCKSVTCREEKHVGDDEKTKKVEGREGSGGRNIGEMYVICSLRTTAIPERKNR